MFIAGGLGTGGAEKQFIYMLRSLKNMGARIQVITLTQGEFHENSLADLGIEPIQLGDKKILGRIFGMIKAAREFSPHFIQATHFFTNFYAGITGRLCNVISIGAIRGDLHHDLNGVGAAGSLLLRLPNVILANSNNARENALEEGFPARRMFVLHNVIDLDDFDRRMEMPSYEVFDPTRIRVITVARLVPVKRLERFLKALAIARRQVPRLQGIIAGRGPEEVALRQMAQDLGLEPDTPQSGVLFLGERSDIPQLFAQSAVCVLTSDREGFPNVLLEAMSASLPVISTPAGEAQDLVQDGSNGFLVPFDDDQVLANHLVTLAETPGLRQTMGSAGRWFVEQRFSFPRLQRNLTDVYRAIAHQTGNNSVLQVLEPQSRSGAEEIIPFS